MTATQTITTADTEALRAEADNLKVIYERLQTEYGKATAHCQGLRVERAALPDTKHQAILMGDAAAYTNVLERERLIFGEITIAEVAMARARVRYLEAGKEWQLAFRSFTSLEAQRLNANGEMPEGKAKAVTASNMYEGARASLSAMSTALAEAQRSLDETVSRAQNQLR